MNLLWLTDIHLNFLRGPIASQRFGEYLRRVRKFDAIIVTGDIAEAPTVHPLLCEFARGAKRTVYFVLGNHDYYKGSIEGVEQMMGQGLEPNLVWLDAAQDPILLDDSTALVGQTGWYDGIFGNADTSDVTLSDFEWIADFRPLFRERAWLHFPANRTPLIEKLRELSRQHAAKARGRLEAALKLRKYVIFGTHYPPFPGACWHQGKLSDSNWMPWFTSGAMGEMLAEVAAEHPDHRILVLCGHTHSSGFYEHLPNLFVQTGKAQYGAPDVAGTLTLPLQHWESQPGRCDRCEDQDFAISATLIECKTCRRVWGRVNGAWVLDHTS